MNTRDATRAELVKRLREAIRERDRVKLWPRDQRRKRGRKWEAYRIWCPEPHRGPRKGCWAPVSEDWYDNLKCNVTAAVQALAQHDED